MPRAGERLDLANKLLVVMKRYMNRTVWNLCRTDRVYEMRNEKKKGTGEMIIGPRK